MSTDHYSGSLADWHLRMADMFEEAAGAGGPNAQHCLTEAQRHRAEAIAAIPPSLDAAA